MSQKNERAKRATTPEGQEVPSAEILITLKTGKKGLSKIEIKHPENSDLAINMMLDALRIMVHSNIQKARDEATSSILIPTKKDIELVN